LIKPILLAACLIFLSPLLLISDLPAQTPESQPEFTIKLATLAPDGTSWSEAGDNFKRYVEEESRGRVRVTWYYGGVMGDEPDVFLKIRLGYLQGGGFTTVGLANMVPETQVLSLPFLFRDYAEVDHVIARATPRFQQLFSRQGFFLSEWVEAGFNYWFTRQPVKSPADFHSCRLGGDRINAEISRRVGFQSREMLVSNISPGLKSGSLNSLYAPPYAVLALQWYPRVKYFIDHPFSYTPGALIIEQKFFQSLPEDLQEIIRKAGKLFFLPLKQTIRRDNQKALEGLLARGIQRIEFDDETVKTLREKTSSLSSELSGQAYPSWLLKGILRSLQEYRRGGAGPADSGI